jgi:hypothetical protein
MEPAPVPLLPPALWRSPLPARSTSSRDDEAGDARLSPSAILRWSRIFFRSDNSSNDKSLSDKIQSIYHFFIIFPSCMSLVSC